MCIRDRGGEYLPALPDPFLQIHLSELRQALGLDAQAPAPHIDAPRTHLPGWALDAQRSEQAGLEVIKNLLSCDLLHNSRKHIRGSAVTVSYTHLR